MSTHKDATGFSIDQEPSETDRANCRFCKGTGSVRVLVGPDEMEAPCEDCRGQGVEQTREDFMNAIDRMEDDRDLMADYGDEGDEL